MNRKAGVILSYIYMIFEVLSTLLLTPFIIRTLGQAEYGVYKLSAAVVAYLMLLDLGLGNAIIRYIAKYCVENDVDQERRFLGVATIYYVIIAVVALMMGVILIVLFPTVFATGLSEGEIQLGQELLGITMINAVVTLATTAYANVILAYEKFFVSKGVPIIQIILRMIFTYIALKEGMGSVGIVLVNLVMTIICRSYYVLYVLFVMKLKPMLKGIKFSFIREIVSYSSLILLQMVATQINNTVDQVLLGIFVPASTVLIGVYGVGSQITNYFQSIGSAFNGVLMPGVVRMVETDNTPQRIMREMVRIGRIIFMVLVLIWGGFLVLGKEFITLWAGAENIEAYYVAIILMTCQLFYLSESVGSQILWAMNEHKEQSILKIVIVLLNIVLTILLIQWNPLIGATVGTFISIALGDVGVMNFIFWKKLKVHMGYFYKEFFKGILPCASISIIVGFLIRDLYSVSWVGLIIKIVIMCVVYIVSLLLFGMNRYERDLCKSMISGIRILKKRTY